MSHFWKPCDYNIVSESRTYRDTTRRELIPFTSCSVPQRSFLDSLLAVLIGCRSTRAADQSSVAMVEFIGLATCGPPSYPPQAAYALCFKSAIRPLPPLTSSNVVPCLRLVPYPNTFRLGVLVRKVTPRGRRSFSRCSYQSCMRAGGGANGWRGADLRQPCRHRISFVCVTDANAATRISGLAV